MPCALTPTAVWAFYVPARIADQIQNVRRPPVEQVTRETIDGVEAGYGCMHFVKHLDVVALDEVIGAVSEWPLCAVQVFVRVQLQTGPPFVAEEG